MLIKRTNAYKGRAGARILPDGSLSDGSGMVAPQELLEVDSTWLGSGSTPTLIPAGGTVTISVSSISDFQARSIKFPSEIAAGLCIKSVRTKQKELLPSENLIPCSMFTEVATNNSDLQFEVPVVITSKDLLDVELVNISSTDKLVVFALPGEKVGN
jgi:hypothetical protein